MLVCTIGNFATTFFVGVFTGIVVLMIVAHLQGTK